MKTKLKYLTSYWSRTIVPAAGAALGKIFYTTKNTTGIRKQYVFDLDTKIAKYQKINASPANVVTEPGAVLIKTTIVPSTDKKLYMNSNEGTDNDALPILLAEDFTLTINDDETPYVENILDHIERTGFTTLNRKQLGLTLVMNTVEAGFTLSTTAGSTYGELTIANTVVADTYELEFTVTDKSEPSITETFIITIEVNAV